MKIFKYIIAMLPFFICAQKNSTISLDAGIPHGIISMGYYSTDYHFFVKAGLKVFNLPEQDLVYDLPPDKFEFHNRGKINSFYSFSGGFVFQSDSNQLLFAGLRFGFNQEYYKRYDKEEILGENGRYFIKNENGLSLNIFPGFGIIFPIGKRENSSITMGLDYDPMNVYLGYGFQF